METGCLSPEEIDAMLAGRMRVADRERAEEHVDRCSSCRIVLGNVAADDTGIATDALATGETAVDSPRKQKREPKAVPNHIGRYEILKKLGSGGMGVVLLAEDSDLKRKVVIKLLRPEMVEPDSDGRERLLREAQAMAKMSHANVVPIYDVGVHEDQVFLAMEYLDGGDLAEWLGTKRALDEIIGVFVQAGRGLAAAHRAGLVHRDFKPHNVLLGKNGEVKVTDFGLARTELAPPSQERKLDRARPRVSTKGGDLSVATLLDSPITQTGTMVGTPAYMAPEQILAQFVDARTDQFSFCVALYEALYGQRPFIGHSTQELFDSTLSGQVPVLATDRRVPARIRDAVRRGLSVEPSDRFPAMEPLLAELAPRRRAAWIAIGAGGVVAIAATIAIVLVARGGKSEACTGLEKGLAGTWDAEQSAKLKERFAATGGEKAFPFVAQTLDRYAKTWIDVRVDACRAARVRGDQTEAHLARRMACLDARKVELRALVTRLVDHADASHPQAANAASKLVSPTTCASPSAVAYPEPDKNAPNVLAAEEEIAGLGIEIALGSSEKARAKITTIVAKVDEIAYPPLQADAHMLAGSVARSEGDMARAEAEIRLALRYAELGQYDHGRARAMLNLADLLVDKGDLTGAKNSIEAAEATVARIGGDAALAIDIVSARADLANAEGNFEEYLALSERMLADQIKLHGEDHMVTASTLMQIASANYELGRMDEGKRMMDRSYKVLEKAFPEQQAGIPIMHLTQEQVRLMMAGEPRAALDVAKRALVLMQGEAGFPARFLAEHLTGIAILHFQMEEWGAARDMFIKAAKLSEELKLANAVATNLELAGKCELELGKHELAIALFRRAVAAAPADSFERVTARSALGRALAEYGSVDDALADLELALPRYEDRKPQPRNQIGMVRLGLANALWRRAKPGDRDRAYASAQLALEDIRAHKAQWPTPKGIELLYVKSADQLIAKVEKWIAAHPVPKK